MFIYNHVKNREYITLLHINRKNCIYYGMGPIHMPKTIGKTRRFHTKRLWVRYGCIGGWESLSGVFMHGYQCPIMADVLPTGGWKY